MKSIQLGDVFEIPAPSGKEIFQYVHQHKTIGELIRILPGLYETTPENIDPIVNQKELYFVHFPLKAAYRRGIVDCLGNFDIPQSVSIPAHFRDKHVVRGDFICWHIVDYATWKRTSVKELSKEQVMLSPWGVWNDTL